MLPTPLPSNSNTGSHRQLSATIQQHATASLTFCRETITGLSHAQTASLNQLLDILDTVSPHDPHPTYVNLVGFGGTGKHQLLRILDEFFNDRSHNSGLRIEFLLNANQLPHCESHVVVRTTLPFNIASARPHATTEYIIHHAGFSAVELRTRLSSFGAPLPSEDTCQQICTCVANYGLGSFALVLGMILSKANIQCPYQSILRKKVALGTFEDNVAQELLAFHPTLRNIRRNNQERNVENLLRPYLPHQVSASALPTLRRVVSDLIDEETCSSPLQALCVPPETYQSFNELASKLIAQNASYLQDERRSITISAELPNEVASRLAAIARDTALSEDSKFTTMLGILILNSKHESLADNTIAASSRVELPPIRFKPLLETFGCARLTLLLGTLFELVRPRKPIMHYSR